jgi:outer membrane lipoprotein-sorting protein
MRRMRALFVLLFLMPAAFFGAEDRHAAMLRKIDALVSFDESDFTAECTIVQDKPGEGRSVTVSAVFRRDAEGKYLILILEPKADKGKGYLKIDNNLWFYDPADRRFTFTSAKERFQNSNARNSDFTRSHFARDYRVVEESSGMLGKFKCRILALEAITDEVAFPKTKIWVSEDDLVRKTEDYSLSGQLLRTTAIPTYQKVGTRYVPASMLIVDAIRGKTIGGKFINEKTQLTIAKPSLVRQPDALFTKAYLEKVSR